MAMKLKDMHLTSVDLVRAGANQEADICFFKSEDPANAQDGPTEGETTIFKQFLNWLRKNPTAGTDAPTDTIEKDATTFNGVQGKQAVSEDLWKYTDALNTSIRSIFEDQELDETKKLLMMQESLTQFDAAMGGLFKAMLCGPEEGPPPGPKGRGLVEKQESARFDIIEEVP